jgi:putative transcriptional regulator
VRQLRQVIVARYLIRGLIPMDPGIAFAKGSECCLVVAARRRKRSLFRELMSGVEAMRDHREGRLTLKTREVQPITVPPINADVVRETREALKMSRHVFAFKIGVNPRTPERWEQG